MRLSFHVLPAFRLALIVALATPVAAARGQSVPDAPADGGSFDGILRALDLKAKPAQRPDFVERSRPADGAINYMPVGTDHPAGEVKTLTPAEVAATTADLDQARMAQQRRAGVKPLPVPLKVKPVGKPGTSILR